MRKKIIWVLAIALLIAVVAVSCDQGLCEVGQPGWPCCKPGACD